MIRATVFGGPKSRLRSYASPFHSGQVWIYHEPVKDTRKLSDFDVHHWRPGLRELYDRAMAADAVAQTILASHGGGGSWNKALSLAEASLDALENADEEVCSRIVVWFLWQWAGFLGLMPELDHCSSCAQPMAAGSMLWYSLQEGIIACGTCLEKDRGTVLEAGPGCRRWLETIRNLPAVQVPRYTLDEKSFRQAKVLVSTIIAEALGRPLACWEW